MEIGADSTHPGRGLVGRGVAGRRASFNPGAGAA